MGVGSVRSALAPLSADDSRVFSYLFVCHRAWVRPGREGGKGSLVQGTSASGPFAALAHCLCWPVGSTQLIATCFIGLNARLPAQRNRHDASPALSGRLTQTTNTPRLRLFRPKARLSFLITTSSVSFFNDTFTTSFLTPPPRSSRPPRSGGRRLTSAISPSSPSPAERRAHALRRGGGLPPRYKPPHSCDLVSDLHPHHIES